MNLLKLRGSSLIHGNLVHPVIRGNKDSVGTAGFASSGSNLTLRRVPCDTHIGSKFTT